MFKNLLQVVRLQACTRCERKEPLRRDGLDYGGNPRIKKCVADSGVGGPNVECEHEFSGRPVVERTGDSHGCEVGEAGRGVVLCEIDIL